MLKTWRGYDIASRCKKIERAVNLKPLKTAEDFPIVINAPTYFGFGDKTRPPEYWREPKVMVKFQEDGFARHLAEVNDDTVPYFMPWFGTGVLASAFGCEVREAKGYGDDPAVISHCVQKPADIARLKMPDPYKDGWMPRVLEAIDYARAHSDLPVGLTDMNSPLCTVAQLCNYENMFIWMRYEKNAMHELFDMVTDAFVHWVKVQKKHIGEPLDQSNGLQGIWGPRGVGVWMSDDDIVSMSPRLYEEFVVPCYSRAFSAFGGGSLHFCGRGSHMVENILKIDGVRVVNNSTLGNIEKFGLLARGIEGKLAIQIQDAAYRDMRGYFAGLFNQLQSLNGVMVATFVQDNTALAVGGGDIEVDKSAFETSREIVRTVRELVAKKLAGQPLE